jgi:hypothetical protein
VEKDLFKEILKLVLEDGNTEVKNMAAQWWVGHVWDDAALRMAIDPGWPFFGFVRLLRLALRCSLATLTYLSQKPGNIVSAVDSLLKSSNTGEEEQRDIATLGESACALWAAGQRW